MAINKDNVDKRMEGKGDLKIAEGLMRLAQKDKDVLKFDLDNEILQSLKNALEINGKPGETLTDFINRIPIEELREIPNKYSDGGRVDFSGYTPGQLKAIFKSETGREPTSPKELVRVIKLYFSGMDEDGIPYGAFEGKN